MPPSSGLTESLEKPLNTLVQRTLTLKPLLATGLLHLLTARPPPSAQASRQNTKSMSPMLKSIRTGPRSRPSSSRSSTKSSVRAVRQPMPFLLKRKPRKQHRKPLTLLLGPLLRPLPPASSMDLPASASQFLWSGLTQFALLTKLKSAMARPSH